MSKDQLYTPPVKKFIDRLADESRPPINAYNVAVVVAHPDDEALGCGATLERLRGAHVVVVTDGVPRHDKDGSAQFPPAHTQAVLRWRELLAALQLAGHKPSAVSGLAIADRDAAENLVSITRRLARLFDTCGTAIALTHAYEGVDPDQDATAFAVHHAAAMCRRAGQDVTLLEMPLHRPAANSAMAEGGDTITIFLNAEGRSLKARMLACFEGGTEAPHGFALDSERFRLAPDYDFEEPASGREVTYWTDDGDLDAVRWCDLVASARQRLGEQQAGRQS